jgi:hypothetical protein
MAASTVMLGMAMSTEVGAILAMPSPPTNPYVEQYDAGGLTDPQDVTGLVDGITGSIGGIDDVDVFRFQWLTDASLTLYYAYGATSPSSLYVSLFSEQGLIPVISPQELLNDDFLFVNDLSAGTYLFKVATTSTSDPPFTFGLFSGPLGQWDTTPNVGPAPMPEPVTLSLLGLGLAAIGAARRKKRAA